MTLAVAIFVLRNVRRTVELSEDRMQYLTDERDRLAFLREEHRSLEEKLKQEHEERLEAQRRAESAERERPAKTERKLLAEKAEREREQRLRSERQAEEAGQEVVRLRQEHRQLMEQIERERVEHLETRSGCGRNGPRRTSRYRHASTPSERPITSDGRSTSVERRSKTVRQPIAKAFWRTYGTRPRWYGRSWYRPGRYQRRGHPRGTG